MMSCRVRSIEIFSCAQGQEHVNEPVPQQELHARRLYGGWAPNQSAVMPMGNQSPISETTGSERYDVNIVERSAEVASSGVPPRKQDLVAQDEFHRAALSIGEKDIVAASPSIVAVDVLSESTLNGSVKGAEALRRGTRSSDVSMASEMGPSSWCVDSTLSTPEANDNRPAPHTENDARAPAPLGTPQSHGETKSVAHERSCSGRKRSKAPSSAERRAGALTEKLELSLQSKSVVSFASPAEGSGEAVLSATGKVVAPNGKQQSVAHGNAPSAPPPVVDQSQTNLFIRNLHRKVDDAMLNSVFGSFGTIMSSTIMRDIHTGESMGTGFVRYSQQSDAQSAISQMNGMVVMGKTIFVQWAKKQHDSAPTGMARRKIHKLFLRNVPIDVTTDQLGEMFVGFGPLRSITIHKDTAPSNLEGMERHIAFVVFVEDGCAEKAAEAVHNTKPFPTCNGIPIMVKLAEDYNSKAPSWGEGNPRNSAHTANTSRPHQTQQPQPAVNVGVDLQRSGNTCFGSPQLGGEAKAVSASDIHRPTSDASGRLEVVSVPGAHGGKFPVRQTYAGRHLDAMADVPLPIHSSSDGMQMTELQGGFDQSFRLHAQHSLGSRSMGSANFKSAVPPSSMDSRGPGVYSVAGLSQGLIAGGGVPPSFSMPQMMRLQGQHAQPLPLHQQQQQQQSAPFAFPSVGQQMFGMISGSHQTLGQGFNSSTASSFSSLPLPAVANGASLGHNSGDHSNGHKNGLNFPSSHASPVSTFTPLYMDCSMPSYQSASYSAPYAPQFAAHPGVSPAAPQDGGMGNAGTLTPCERSMSSIPSIATLHSLTNVSTATGNNAYPANLVTSSARPPPIPADNMLPVFTKYPPLSHTRHSAPSGAPSASPSEATLSVTGVAQSASPSQGMVEPTSLSNFPHFCMSTSTTIAEGIQSLPTQVPQEVQQLSPLAESLLPAPTMSLLSSTSSYPFMAAAAARGGASRTLDGSLTAIHVGIPALDGSNGVSSGAHAVRELPGDTQVAATAGSTAVDLASSAVQPPVALPADVEADVSPPSLARHPSGEFQVPYFVLGQLDEDDDW